MHYGVPGMKWGVRKARAAFSNSRANKKLEKDEAKAIKTIANRGRTWQKRYRNVGDMSTAELKRNLNRLKLENEFARQVKEANPPKAKSKAKQFILGYGKEIITSDPVKNAIKDSIKGYITGGAAGAVKGAKKGAAEGVKSEAKNKVKEKVKSQSSSKKKKSKPDIIDVPDDEIIRKEREVTIRQSEGTGMTTYSSAERIESYLEHYGVKGMKWGKRSSDKPVDIEGAGGGGGDMEEDEEERERKQKELQEIAAAINEKGEKIGKKIEKFADDPQKAIDKKLKKTKKSIDKGVRDIKNDRLVRAMSKSIGSAVTDANKALTKARIKAGFRTEAEQRKIDRKEKERIRKKYGGMPIKLEKRK